MADEVIGSVAVQIVGDYSSLQGDIDAAAQVAQKGGEEIAAALSAGASGADALSGSIATAAAGIESFEGQIQALVDTGSTLAEALAAVGAGAAGIGDSMEAAAAGAEQAGAAVEQAAGAMADVGAAAQTAATELGGVGVAGQSVGAGVDQARDALGRFTAGAAEAGEAAHHAAEGSNELLKSLLEIGGIAVSIEALKEFAAESIEVYAATEKAQLSLGFLTGDAAAAADTIEHLKEVAMDLAVPFDQLVKAQQTMTAFGFTAEQISSSLQAAADAAAATGHSFDTVASAMERMALTGTVSNRQLVQLGLSAQDLADVMGVSSDQVAAAFKKISEAAQMDVVTAALEKWHGAAATAAEGTAGALQRLATQWHISMDEIGKDLAPVVSAVANFVTSLDYYFAEAIIRAEGLAQSLAHSVLSTKDALTFDFGGAVAQYQAAQKADADMAGSLATLKELHDSTAAAVENHTAKTKEEVQAEVQAQLAAAASTAELKNQRQELETFSASTFALFDKLPEGLADSADAYDNYLKKLTEGGETAAAMLKQVQGEIDKAHTAMQGMSDEATLASMNAWVDALQKAQVALQAFADSDAAIKSAQKIALLADQFGPDVLAGLDAFTLDIINDMQRIARDVPDALDKIKPEELIGKLLAAQQKLDDQTQKMTDHFAKGMERMAEEAQKPVPVIVTLDQELSGVGNTIQAIADRQGQAWNTAGIARYHDMVVAMNAEGLKTLQQQEAQIKGDQQLLDLMTKFNQPLGERLDLQGKILQAEIAEDTEVGASATKQIIALNNIRIQQQLLYDQTHLLGDMYVGVFNDILKGFDSLGKGIADNIIDEKNWGDMFVSIGKQIAKSILEDIVGTAFKALKDAILGSITDVGGLGNAFKSLGSTIKSIFSGGGADAGVNVAGQLAGNVGPDAMGLAGSAGSAGASAAGAASSGASSAAGGLSSVMGTIGAVSAAVGAISSIIGNFQQAKMETTLNAIEKSTRYTEIYTGEQGDGILQTGHAIRDILSTQMMGDIESLIDIGNGIRDLLGTVINTLYIVNGQAGASPAGSPEATAITALGTLLGTELGKIEADLSGGAIGTAITAGLAPLTSSSTLLTTQMNNLLIFQQQETASLIAINQALVNIPKLASGTAFVQSDMLAYIHQGEAVVPAGGLQTLQTSLASAQSVIATGPVAAAAVGLPMELSTFPSGDFSGVAERSVESQYTPYMGGVIPGLPGVPQPVAAPSMPVSTTTGSSAGTINANFTILEASNPRETARQMANVLKTLSPRFVVYNQ